MIGLEAAIERWELIEPFATARDCVSQSGVVVTLAGRNGQRGWAEAAGVYDGETPNRWCRLSPYATNCGTTSVGRSPAAAARWRRA
jgi:hypothetical protein